VKAWPQVLRDDPEQCRHVAPGVPRDLNRLSHSALRKDRDRRSHSMADVKIALGMSDRFFRSTPTGLPGPGEPMVGVTAAGVLIAVSGRHRFLREAGDRTLSPQGDPIDVRHQACPGSCWSPDGQVRSPMHRTGAGKETWYLGPVPAVRRASRLTKDEANEHPPDFSPDGTKIAFRFERDSDGIYVVPVVGESRDCWSGTPPGPSIPPMGIYCCSQLEAPLIAGNTW